MNSNSNSNNNSNTEWHRKKTFKRRRYSNINNISNQMANMALKKKVTFRHKRNGKNNIHKIYHNISKENENVEARKSIRNKTPLTQENINYLNSLKHEFRPDNKLYIKVPRSEKKLKRHITKEYLKGLHRKGKYHLNNTNKNLIEETLEKMLGTF